MLRHGLLKLPNWLGMGDLPDSASQVGGMDYRLCYGAWTFVFFEEIFLGKMIYLVLVGFFSPHRGLNS